MKTKILADFQIYISEPSKVKSSCFIPPEQLEFMKKKNIEPLQKVSLRAFLGQNNIPLWFMPC